ncbi:MAG TPA: nuclear transport factor 2 family protein [Polyangiaceae bacterium]
MKPLDRTRAYEIAHATVDAWNSHDLERILEHYADDCVLVSPVALERLGDATVRGKAALRAYFGKALAAHPELRFDLKDVMWGISSVVLYYANQRGSMTGEFMEIDAAGKISRVVATYNAEVGAPKSLGEHE